MGPACVCEDGGLRAAIREDLDRYVFVGETQHGIAGFQVPFRAWLLSQGLWATTAYRLTHYARYRLRSRLLRVLPFILHITAIEFTGINIDSGAHIGPGLRIPHGGYIVTRSCPDRQELRDLPGGHFESKREHNRWPSSQPCRSQHRGSRVDWPRGGDCR